MNQAATFLLDVARPFSKYRKGWLDAVHEDIPVELELGIGPAVGEHIQEGGFPTPRRAHKSQYLPYDPSANQTASHGTAGHERGVRAGFSGPPTQCAAKSSKFASRPTTRVTLNHTKEY